MRKKLFIADRWGERGSTFMVRLTVKYTYFFTLPKLYPTLGFLLSTSGSISYGNWCRSYNTYQEIYPRTLRIHLL